jgi:transposase
VRMETFIRKELRMKSHYITHIDETDQVVIAHVARIGKRKLRCSGCRATCRRTHGRLKARRWRDLGLRDRPLELNYQPFRVRCRRCQKVKVEKVPWAEPWSRVTLSLVAAVALLARKLNWLEVARHFQLDWKTVAQIVQCVVAEGLKRRPWKPLHIIGVDEVSRKRGHRYLTLVYDLERHRLIWIGEDRKKETLDSFFRWLNRKRSRSIRSVCCDMWAPYAKSIREHLPQATLVFDRFHLVRHLLDAVDEVRRQEVRRLSGTHKQIIKGTRFVLLKNPWNLTAAQRDSLFNLTRLNLRIVRAYLLKETFQLFWHYKRPFYANRFLRDWLWKASHSRLEPIKKFVQLVRSHIDGILAWTTLRISNGALEGFNNKVKLVSHRAFGFRTITHYIAAIYHVCADLPFPDFSEACGHA